MYEKNLRSAQLRRERQQRSVEDTKHYLDVLTAIPGVSPKTTGAVSQKLARQREALRVTDDELITLRLLIDDPAQISIDTEIDENEKTAAAKTGRRR